MKSYRNSFFVTGIGTEVGKTVISSILVRALQADYWKPVQSGDLEWSDTDKVRAWSGMDSSTFFPEAYRLKQPLSPHASAERDGVLIDRAAFALPKTSRPLIVEGAGGLYVPLNRQDTMLDLIQDLGLPVILVSRHYLGSINHTLLSLSALKQRGISLAGLIFNGSPNPDTESVIEQMAGVEHVFRIEEMEKIDSDSIAALAAKHHQAIENLMNI